MDSTTLRSHSGWAYLQLMRPANIVTAWADILVGFAASGAAVVINEFIDAQAVTPQIGALLTPLVWLLIATTGLYGGGVVFNDVFDAELDAKERPERPIPSGRASRQGATILGSSLLTIGVLAALQVSELSAVLAGIIACAALSYDAIAKHHTVLGPLNMGLCRGGNLLLGMSAVPAVVGDRWYLAIIPILYIAAITAISQGEVSGGKTMTGAVALLLIGLVISGVLALGLLPGYQSDYHWLAALPFVILLAIRVIPPFVTAAREPQANPIRTAVKAGVLSLIVLDAAIASGFAGLLYGLLVLLLLPLSMGLARLFAVT